LRNSLPAGWNSAGAKSFNSAPKLEVKNEIIAYVQNIVVQRFSFVKMRIADCYIETVTRIV